jgi:hypothetical protein
LERALCSLLLWPGAADVVVLDEAHRIKSRNTALNRALSAVRTPRRVLLTGFVVFLVNEFCLNIHLSGGFSWFFLYSMFVF